MTVLPRPIWQVGNVYCEKPWFSTSSKIGIARFFKALKLCKSQAAAVGAAKRVGAHSEVDFQFFFFRSKSWGCEFFADSIHTVDGRNPAPVNMINIPLFIGFHTSQVVQDFSHQQYLFPGVNFGENTPMKKQLLHCQNAKQNSTVLK